MTADSDQSPSEESPKNYDVGYGKPPKRSRFQKGKSGNSRGRPRGSLNCKTLLQEALHEQVIIEENGEPKTVSKLVAGFKRFATKFASGDPKALRLVASMFSFADEYVDEGIIGDTVDPEFDRRILESIVKRIESASRKEPENGCDSQLE